MAQKLRVLFLCTGKSCRSPMAEGRTRRLKADTIEASSAGIAPRVRGPAGRSGGRRSPGGPWP